jgi:GalNAc5-diNAcBac-PP-undecaprenol beta-1,3-glucosyltransferase
MLPESASLPLITLIIPTHLRPVLLQRALASVNAQTHRDRLEIIVISDAVDPATEQVCGALLERGDIFVRRNGQAGPSASRNLGLQLAKGRFVMFLDDDDAWQAGFVEALLAQLPHFSGSAAYFNCTVVKESRPATGPVKLGESALDMSQKLNDAVFVKNQVHMSCYLFSRHLLSGLEFDASMRGYEDWDFILAALKREMAVHLPIACSLVHEVDDSTTDRRGSNAGAKDRNAVIDYLYVYRRHAAPSPEVLAQRKSLLDSVGLDLPQELL